MRIDLLIDEEMTITAPAFLWLTVHGFVCLALRHPETLDHDMRPQMIAFTEDLMKDFLERDFITQDEYHQIQQTEAAAEAQIIKAGYEKILDWIDGVESMNPGGFLTAIAQAANQADGEDFELMRPLLLELQAKYPKYHVPRSPQETPETPIE